MLNQVQGETATITAKVLDANGNPCVGETVSFEVVNGESLGSDVTDSSGEASVSYLGKGTGDLYIKGICGIIVTETYDIEDCIFYGINTNAFTIPANTTFSSNGEMITATTNTSGEKLVYLNHQLTNSDNWVFETELAQIETKQSLAVVWNDNSFWGGQTIDHPENVYSNMGGNDSIQENVAVGKVFKVTRENGVTTVTFNGRTVQSKTIAHKDTFKVGYFINSGRTQYYKNIKLKPL